MQKAYRKRSRPLDTQAEYRLSVPMTQALLGLLRAFDRGESSVFVPRAGTARALDRRGLTANQAVVLRPHVRFRSRLTLVGMVVARQLWELDIEPEA